MFAFDYYNIIAALFREWWRRETTSGPQAWLTKMTYQIVTPWPITYATIIKYRRELERGSGSSSGKKTTNCERIKVLRTIPSSFVSLLLFHQFQLLVGISTFSSFRTVEKPISSFCCWKLEYLICRKQVSKIIRFIKRPKTLSLTFTTHERRSRGKISLSRGQEFLNA